jgi:hypothetical protein
VGDVSADTRQTNLTGKTIHERPPSHPQTRVFYEAGELSDGDVSFRTAARYAAAADRFDTMRVVAWIERAADEGVLVEEATRP